MTNCCGFFDAYRSYRENKNRNRGTMGVKETGERKEEERVMDVGKEEERVMDVGKEEERVMDVGKEEERVMDAVLLREKCMR